MSDTEILCAGRIYCDLVFTELEAMPRLGTEVFAGGLGLHAGGGAFITAATFCALGRRTGLWGILPVEPFGGLLRVEIEGAGIDTGLCAPAPPGSDPQITVAMATGGDRAFLTRAPGAALPAVDSLAGARHLHIGELRTLREHPDLVDLARAAGMTISLDCGWEKGFSEGCGELIRRVDVFLPNEREAAALGQAGLPSQPAPLTVIKRGARGGSALWDGGRLDAPAPSATPRDPTGAGDAFNAGFLDRWLAGADLADCLAAGNACGAATVGAVGGTGGVPAIRKLASVPLDAP